MGMMSASRARITIQTKNSTTTINLSHAGIDQLKKLVHAVIYQLKNELHIGEISLHANGRVIIAWKAFANFVVLLEIVKIPNDSDSFFSA